MAPHSSGFLVVRAVTCADDVVDYLTMASQSMGLPAKNLFTVAKRGNFVGNQHRDMCETDPANYAARYGGFCSWDAASGKRFDVDPVNGLDHRGRKAVSQP